MRGEFCLLERVGTILTGKFSRPVLRKGGKRPSFKKEKGIKVRIEMHRPGENWPGPPKARDFRRGERDGVMNKFTGDASSERRSGRQGGGGKEGVSFKGGPRENIRRL